jgi:hypothetical protein
MVDQVCVPTHTVRPAAQFWQLVSGDPSGKRERRKFVILEPQAVIDDSATQPNPKYFVLAGFVSSAARWIEFSAEWQSALDLAPKLAYFKMNEANLLVGEFARDRGWTEALRDDRVITLTRIIKKHVLLRLHAAIKFADFEKYIASIEVPERKNISDHPYIYLFTKLICAMAVRSTLFNINEPCDFIFDNQEGISDEIFRQWSDFKETAFRVSKSDFPTFLGVRPIFRDDKCFKPLQAADLFANQYRNYLEQNSGRVIVPANRVLRQILPIPAIDHECTVEELEHLHNHLLKFKDALLERYPIAELFGFAETAQERRLIRKRARRKWSKKQKGPQENNP